MDFESLRIFLAVADHGGLLAAARALEQPKQTVSRRLAALEAEIGVELFARARIEARAGLGACFAVSGTAHADMDAHQFLARLCALVPPPGFHMTRYYGVLASHHRLRERVIPKPAVPPPPPQLPLDFALADDSPASSPSSSPRPRRIAWAKLLARIFALDITRCRKCGGRMRVLEVVSDADAIARILHGARAPPAPPPLGQVLLFP